MKKKFHLGSDRQLSGTLENHTRHSQQFEEMIPRKSDES